MKHPTSKRRKKPPLCLVKGAAKERKRGKIEAATAERTVHDERLDDKLAREGGSMHDCGKKGCAPYMRAARGLGARHAVRFTPQDRSAASAKHTELCASQKRDITEVDKMWDRYVDDNARELGVPLLDTEGGVRPCFFCFVVKIESMCYLTHSLGFPRTLCIFCNFGLGEIFDRVAGGEGKSHHWMLARALADASQHRGAFVGKFNLPK